MCSPRKKRGGIRDNDEFYIKTEHHQTTQSTMRVANPIYDVVFKFLMGDMRIAKLILSKILDQEIESLEFKPTEFRKKIGLNLTVFRIDFSAVIRQPDGSRKLALIEIQKAKLPTDIMRFRKYLGGHYQDPNNVYSTDNGASEKALLTSWGTLSNTPKAR